MGPQGGKKLVSAASRTNWRAREPFLIFVFFWLVYAATSSGDLTADTNMRWKIATYWLDHATLATDADLVDYHAIGRCGRAYPIWAPAQSLLLLPFVGSGRLLATLPLPLPGTATMYGQFLASVMLFPAVGAAGLVALYAIAIDAAQSQRAARRIVLLAGLATMHWHHTISGADESQVALGLLVGVWAAQRAWLRHDTRYRWLAGVALGAAIAVRYSAALPAGAILISAVCFDWRRCAPDKRARAARRWGVALLTGFVPLAALLAGYNYARFGSIAETGYAQVYAERLGGLSLFQTPLAYGLVSMLLSPGKGLLVFNPILLAAIPVVTRLFREHAALATTVLLASGAALLLHARFTVWAGDLTWGVRYLASCVAMLSLGLLPLLERDRIARWVIGLALLSATIQIASVVYSYALEFFQDRRHGLVPDAYVWRPAESQLVCRFHNIAMHALGRPEIRTTAPAIPNAELHQTPVPLESVRLLHQVHFFPFKAYYTTRNVLLGRVLLVGWCGLLMGAAWLACAWWRLAGRLEASRAR